MDVAHVDIQSRQHGHRLTHRIGDIVQLQVEENPVSPAFDLPHDGRTFGVEKLHADLQKGFARLVAEKIEEAERIFCGLEVAGDDYITVHSCMFEFLFPIIRPFETDRSSGKPLGSSTPPPR